MIQWTSMNLVKEDTIAMTTLVKVLLIILIILVAVLIVLYFVGKRAQKKQAEQQEQIAAAAQNVTMLIIDKKKMRLKDAGLPAIVYENTPKLLRRSKLPIVKAKVGPKVMTLICDEAIFDSIPLKKEVKAVVSGMYITSVRGMRGPLEKVDNTKKSWLKRTQEKLKNKANGAK